MSKQKEATKDSIIIVLGDFNEGQLTALNLSNSARFYHYSTSNSQNNELNFEVTKLELSPEDKSRINYDILERIKGFAGIESNKGTNADILSFDGFSFWYYSRFRIYFNLRNFYYQIALIEDLKKEHGQVTICHNQLSIKEYFEKDEGITHIDSEIKPKKEGINFRYLSSYFASLSLRTISSIFKLRKFKTIRNLIVTAPTQYGTIGNGPNQKEYNKFFGSSLTSKSNDFAIIDLLQPPKPRGNQLPPRFKTILRKETYPKIGSEAIFLRFGVLSISNYKQLKSTSNSLRQAYKELASPKDSIDQFIHKELKRLHKSSLLYYYQYLAYKSLFKKCQFETISAIDENGSNTKPLMDAAKTVNIVTVGIQHGAIHDLHPSYMYGEYDKQHQPFPDYTLVWGSYYRDVLLKNSSYGTGNITSIGQLRTDILERDVFKNALDQQEVGGSDHSIIVTFASQPQRDLELRKKAAEDFLLATKNIENVEAIIKIHPREEKSYYAQLAENLGCKVKILSTEVDLLVLLKKSSIVVTCFSTVGAEAVFMRKPLIIIDHLNQDQLKYIEKGVAQKANSAQEIQSSIEEFINSNYQINKESYNTYIEENAFSIDGKVSERFFDFIRNLQEK